MKKDLKDWKLKKKSERFEWVTTDLEISKTIRKIKNIKALRKQVGVVFQFAEYQLLNQPLKKI